MLSPYLFAPVHLSLSTGRVYSASLMQSYEQLWNDVLALIELEVPKPRFQTWFKNTFISHEENGILYIGVPTQFVREWLTSKYSKTIMKCIRQIDDNYKMIECIVAMQPQKTQSAPLMPQVQSEKPTLPLEMHSINKKDNLNPKYTFQSYIVGPFNELAYSAAQAILAKPGIYNPLYIYGPTGLGKTHLIQAIGNELKKRYPHLQVYYTTSEQFVTNVVGAIHGNSITALKERYRKYDVFIMDDIQFLSGKEKSQEEMFHLFNILSENNKQILFSSDKHPNFIIGLEDRLKSRCSAGMVIDVSKPEFESRLAIIRQKCKDHAYGIPEDVLMFIAQHVEGNIRELEGIINSLSCQLAVQKDAVDINLVKQLIKHNLKSKRVIATEDLVQIVANYYKINPESVFEATRRKEVVRARQVVMFLLRNDFDVSFPQIGRSLGGKDHTTVIHSFEKIKKEIETDLSLNQDIERIRSLISA